MVDVHTHILPSIDDGAKDTTETVQMVDELIKQGVDKVVLTPHFYYNRMPIDSFLLKREKAYEKLIKKTSNKNIKFRLGAEVNVGYYKVEDYNLFMSLNIKDTSYILIELPFTYKWSEEVFYNLKNIIDYTLYTPIIAHIEKYPAISRNPKLVDKLIKMGCIMQLNCSSIFLNSRKRLVKKLLTGKKIHCLSSDAHNMTTRSPLYSNAVEAIEKIIGKGETSLLQKNMNNILDNKDIDVYLTKPIRKILGIYF